MNITNMLKAEASSEDGMAEPSFARSILWLVFFLVLTFVTMMVAIWALIYIEEIGDHENAGRYFMQAETGGFLLNHKAVSLLVIALFATLLPAIIFASNFKCQAWKITLAIRSVPLKKVLSWVFLYSSFLAVAIFCINFFGIEIGGYSDFIQSGGSFILFLALVIFSPFLEELVFRGYLYCAWRRSFLGVWGTIIGTSVLFSAIHAGEYGMPMLLLLFIASILLGLSREATKSIITPILLHMFNNLVAMVFIIYEII